MALADLAALRTLIERPTGSGIYFRTAGSNTTLAETGYFSVFNQNPFALTVATSPVALDSTSRGAPLGSPPPPGNFCLVAATATLDGTTTTTATLRSSTALVIDRLNHQGGIDPGITTLQTTNLPTAALTRYTSGVGVYAALHVNGALGGTDSVITVTYTNSAGTGGRTATVTFVNTPSARAFYPVPLQSGDLGVKSVESVQFSAAVLGGVIGVVLYKPLMFIPQDAMGRRLDATQLPGWNTTVEAGACLEVLPCELQSRTAVLLEWGLV